MLPSIQPSSNFSFVPSSPTSLPLTTSGQPSFTLTNSTQPVAEPSYSPTFVVRSKYRITQTLSGYQAATRRRLIFLMFSSLNSTLMSFDAQYVFIKTVAQVLDVAETQINLVSITGIYGSAIQGIEIVYIVSFYTTTLNAASTMNSFVTALKGATFITRLKENALLSGNLTASAFANTTVSTPDVQLVYQYESRSESRNKSVVMVAVSIVAGIVGFILLVGIVVLFVIRNLRRIRRTSEFSSMREMSFGNDF